MNIGRYLQWVETAPVAARIDAARSLVEIYATPDLDTAARGDVELALFALLDDPAAVVRLGLAEAVAQTIHVPRHLVAALAQDPSSVAVPVLRFSPLLEDADLVEAVAVGGPAAHLAVASRPVLRSGVAAALIETGDVETAIALCGNDMAELTPALLRRMLERFGTMGEMREAMLARGGLDPALRHDLVVATAMALTGFAAQCAWMSPARADQVVREARDRADVTIAAHSARHDGAAGPQLLATHLRGLGHLTPALLLRAILSADLAMFEAALVELSGTPAGRVSGHVRDAQGLGFASLYEKAGLPPSLLPVFRAALQSLRRCEDDLVAGQGVLVRSLVSDVLAACRASADPELGRVTAMLRRLEAEAIRDEARAVSADAWAEDASEAVPALLSWITGAQQALPRLTLQPAA